MYFFQQKTLSSENIIINSTSNNAATTLTSEPIRPWTNEYEISRKEANIPPATFDAEFFLQNCMQTHLEQEETYLIIKSTSECHVNERIASYLRFKTTPETCEFRRVIGRFLFENIIDYKFLIVIPDNVVEYWEDDFSKFFSSNFKKNFILFPKCLKHYTKSTISQYANATDSQNRIIFVTDDLLNNLVSKNIEWFKLIDVVILAGLKKKLEIIGATQPKNIFDFTTTAENSFDYENSFLPYLSKTTAAKNSLFIEYTPITWKQLTLSAIKTTKTTILERFLPSAFESVATATPLPLLGLEAELTIFIIPSKYLVGFKILETAIHQHWPNSEILKTAQRLAKATTNLFWIFQKDWSSISHIFLNLSSKKKIAILWLDETTSLEITSPIILNDNISFFYFTQNK